MPLLENIKKFKKKAVDLYDTGEAMGKKYFGEGKKYKGPRGTYESLYGNQPVHARKKKKKPVVRQARPLTTKPAYAADRPSDVLKNTSNAFKNAYKGANRLGKRILNRKK